MGGALDKAVGYLDKRMVLTVLFPTLVFWSSVLLLIGGNVGWDSALAWWKGLTSEARILLGTGAVVGAVFSASALSVQLGALTRLYEGYWGDGALGRLLARPGLRLQQWRHGRLNPDLDRDFEIRYRMYPRRREDLRPTRLGNVLKGAETYPADVGRYGTDAVFFWPRLYGVLPQPMRALLQDARASFDLMLVVSALGFLYALTAAVFLAVVGSGMWSPWLSAVGGGLLAALLGYRGAVAAAAPYAELVRTSFDLYRGVLLTQMGFAAPSSLHEERKLWENIGQQLYRRAATDPTALRYAATDEITGTATWSAVATRAQAADTGCSGTASGDAG